MDAKKILKDIEKRSKEMFLPIVGPKKGKILEKIIKEQKPKKILEVGSLVGYSSTLMSQFLPRGGKIITIEINPDAFLIAKENFRRAGVENKIEIILGDAMKIIPKLEGPFDMLFLDAEKQEYYNYLLLSESKLSENAVVVADNVKIFENELKDYLDYVRINEHYKSENYDVGFDAIEVSYKKS